MLQMCLFPNFHIFVWIHSICFHIVRNFLKVATWRFYFNCQRNLVGWLLDTSVYKKGYLIKQRHSIYNLLYYQPVIEQDRWQCQ